MLTERDKKTIWHPYTQMKTAPDPIAVRKAKGVTFWDENGKAYLDMISSWWVNVHGHAHPHIAENVYRQFLELEHIIFAGITHEPAVVLAEKLLEMTALQNGKVFYTDNGSTAVEVALKIALQYHQNKGKKHKKKIVALKGAYHGDTFGAMSVSERGGFTVAFAEYLFEVEFLPFPGEDAQITQEKLLQLAEEGETAAFIFEPLVLGAGGMQMYAPESLEALVKICKQNGILTIADEVMTGFGRTGKMLATHAIDTKPDLFCLSKGITGGVMPMGATVVDGYIYEAFHDEDKMKALYHGHSFTANPLSCAAAIASFELFEKQPLSEYQSAIIDFYATFKQELAAYDIIKNIRSCGTILAFDLIAGEQSYFSDIKQTVQEHYLNDGLFVRPLGNVVYFMPPYIITQAELQKAAESTIRLLKQLEQSYEK